MIVDFESMDELLRVYDIEGLIASGAPEDEYEPELDHLLIALEAIPAGQATEEKIVMVFESVWRQMFSSTDSAIKLRRPAFSEIAEKLMKYFQ